MSEPGPDTGPARPGGGSARSAGPARGPGDATAERPGRRVALPHSVVTVDAPGAREADAIARIGLVHDIVASVFDIRFELPDHPQDPAAEPDFLSLFGLRAAFPPVPAELRQGLADEHIPLAEVVAELLRGNVAMLRDGVRYVIKADQERRLPMEALKRAVPFERRFVRNVAYTPASRVFAVRDGAQRCVIHLRRGLICGGVLFAGIDAAGLPRRVTHGVHARPLLQLDEAVRALETALEPGTRVELVVASDGFARLRGKCAGFPELMDRIDRMEAMTLTQPRSDVLDLCLREQIVGQSPESTRRTLDAMHAADVIVTRSSAVPGLMARVSRVRVLTPPG